MERFARDIRYANVLSTLQFLRQKAINTYRIEEWGPVNAPCRP